MILKSKEIKIALILTRSLFLLINFFIHSIKYLIGLFFIEN